MLVTLSICGIILYVANIIVELWCCFPWWSSFVGSISFVSSVVSKKAWFCVESFVHFLTFFVFVLCSSFVLYALMLLSCLESLEPLGLGEEILGTRKEIFLHITKFSSTF